MEAKKILLILGAGPNVANSTAQIFASKGYKIALMSRGRGAAAFDPSYLYIQSDLSQAGSIASVFAQVRQAYGSPPNIVIHNAYHVFPAEATNPLTLSATQINHDLGVNLTSAYLAASEAVKGFETLADELPKSFIYTANGLNMMPQPRLVSLGLGKTAMAHVIENCILAFKGKAWTFYYADERLPDGDFAAGAISGPAHAARYWTLSQDRQQHEWMHTFVAGEGYRKF